MMRIADSDRHLFGNGPAGIAPDIKIKDKGEIKAKKPRTPFKIRKDMTICSIGSYLAKRLPKNNCKILNSHFPDSVPRYIGP